MANREKNRRQNYKNLDIWIENSFLDEKKNIFCD